MEEPYLFCSLSPMKEVISSCFQDGNFIVNPLVLAPDRDGFQILRGYSERPIFCTIVALQEADHLTRKLLLSRRIQVLERGDDRAIVSSKIVQPVRGGAIAENKMPFRRLERCASIVKEVAQSLL